MTVALSLVTGAAGLIGRSVVRRMASEGRALIATDAHDAIAPTGVRHEVADLTDRAAVAALFQKYTVDTVIHCGAISGPMVAAGDPYRVMAVNVGGTLNLAEAARQAGVRRFLALSSIAVYGTQPNLAPVTEAAPLNATDVYGASKIAMEAILRAYRHDFDLPSVVLRIASVYGPGRTTDCFIRDFIRNSMTRTRLNIASDNQCRRQFVHIDDVVAAIVRASAAPRLSEFIYNISGGTWLTEREVAGIAATVLPELTLSNSDGPASCIDGFMGPLDYSRAAAAFDYKPTIELSTGIASYAAWLASETV